MCVTDVHEQAHEAIDEILPGSRLLGQASFQQIAIDFGEGHVTAKPAGTMFAKAALIRAPGGPHRPLDQWRFRASDNFSSVFNLNVDGMRRPYVIYESCPF